MRHHHLRLLTLSVIGLLACNLSAALGTPTLIPSPVPAGVLVQPETALPPPVATTPAPDVLSPLVRLTEPGCCVQPGWSADGQQVVFIDKPDPGQPTGIYGVSINGGPPQLITERIGLPSPD